ncbi:uncharacterized protein [Palaemon carinicauda]|uniref:uncharacterized protein n=1 Tax=Palaemon carinicauda TaxID=392227 RepID=UPI0035B620D4
MDSGMGIFFQSQRHFAFIHLDVVGFLPSSQGNRYLFTVIDHSTCLSEALPTATATFTSYTIALLSGRIARFGIPVYITSGRGTTFTAQLWISLTNILGITIHQTNAYNSAANRMVEHFHHILKAALMSGCKDSK